MLMFYQAVNFVYGINLQKSVVIFFYTYFFYIDVFLFLITKELYILHCWL